MPDYLDSNMMYEVVEGWIYSCRGPRGRKFFYPYSLLEMPLQLGDKINIFSRNGLDVSVIFEQLAELVGAPWIDEFTVIEGVLITDGRSYKLKCSLNAALREVRTHNSKLQQHHENAANIERDNACVSYKPISGQQEWFMQINVQPGWFAKVDNCSVWVEVIDVFDNSLMCMSRNTSLGDTSYYTLYSVQALRPNAPKYGSYIRADGTANYTDKFFPRQFKA